LQDAPLEVKFLGAGQNWMPLSSCIALGMGNYDSPLPKGSKVSVTTLEPGSTIFSGPELVAAGEYHFAITTPSWVGKAAVEGKEPFTSALPLRAIAQFPHDDRMVLAVRTETGITTIRDILERHYPLRISTPRRESRHVGVWLPEQILKLYGFDYDDIISWGGALLHDRPKLVDVEPGMVPIDPTFDAIFDEAIMTRRWPAITDAYDLTFLSIDDDVVAQAERRGWPAGVLRRGLFRGVDEDVQTIDFSGWLLYCHEACDADLAYLTAQALHERVGMINQWFSRPSMGLTSPLAIGNVATGLPIPLHPGAERYYREHGVI
jgi:TRAP-type uncharacterized transport system substrate-binding protein